MASSILKINIPTFNWKALDDTIKTLAYAIDSNTPLEGAGIRLISHGADGVEVARADMAQPPNGQQQQQQQLLVGPILVRVYDVSFIAAQVVDPTTCQTTFVQILIQDPGGWADFKTWMGPGPPSTNPFGG